MLRACHVTVVYPYERMIHVRSVDERTGELLSSSSRKSSSFSEFFLELYRIKAFLTNPNLTVCVAMLETERRNYYCGEKRRRRGMRKEKLPLRYLEELRLDSAEDYLHFLPEALSGFSQKGSGTAYENDRRFASAGDSRIRRRGAKGREARRRNPVRAVRFAGISREKSPKSERTDFRGFCTKIKFYERGCSVSEAALHENDLDPILFPLLCQTDIGAADPSRAVAMAAFAAFG